MATTAPDERPIRMNGTHPAGKLAPMQVFMADCTGRIFEPILHRLGNGLVALLTRGFGVSACKDKA